MDHLHVELEVSLVKLLVVLLVGGSLLLIEFLDSLEDGSASLDTVDGGLEERVELEVILLLLHFFEASLGQLSLIKSLLDCLDLF